MVGQSIGNYRIVEPLGEGGMATVYLALHPELGRRVAVKVMNADLARSDEMVQRFFNEARAASGIGHRGIVEVSDLGRLPSGAPYIVMELLEGESLAQRMTRLGRLPLSTAAEVAGQAASAMEAAHARGIIHRDLKPENLFLIPDPLLPGRELVKVLDFGIAKLALHPAAAGGGELRTRTGAILGTPRYMSPEQCRESRTVDHRADIYSLGVVLYEMLAGAPPFVSSSWGELAHMHIGVTPPPLRTQAPDVPGRVAELVHRALAKDPEQRFQSMTEFKDAVLAAAPMRTAVLPAAIAAGSTVRFGAPEPTRPPRPTTLEAAAAEIVLAPVETKRIAPRVLALALTAGAVVVIGLVALRATPSAPDPTAAPLRGAVTPPKPVAPPKPVTPPPVTVPAPPVEEPSPAQPEVAPAPPPAQPPAVQRKRRKTGAPTKTTAPAPSHPVAPVAPVAPRPEPYKI